LRRQEEEHKETRAYQQGRGTMNKEEVTNQRGRTKNSRKKKERMEGEG
jgi:hypothetical protein